MTWMEPMLEPYPSAQFYLPGPAERVGRAIDNVLRAMASGGAAAFFTLIQWQRMARRRADLAILSDAQLKDIGLTRADIGAELRRPFWR